MQKRTQRQESKYEGQRGRSSQYRGPEGFIQTTAFISLLPFKSIFIVMHFACPQPAHPVKVYSSVALILSVELWKHPHSLIPEHFHHPYRTQQSFPTACQQPLTRLPPRTCPCWTFLIFFLVWRIELMTLCLPGHCCAAELCSGPIAGHFYQWNQAIGGLW